MSKQQAKLLLVLYLVLAFVLVSLSATYSLTAKLFAMGDSQVKYGTGQSFSQKGFLIHIVVYALLAALPFFYIKEYM